MHYLATVKEAVLQTMASPRCKPTSRMTQHTCISTCEDTGLPSASTSWWPRRSRPSVSSRACTPNPGHNDVIIIFDFDSRQKNDKIGVTQSRTKY